MVEALAHRRGEARSSEVMCHECRIIGPLAPLIETWERMRREGCATLAVMDQSRFEIAVYGKYRARLAVAKGAGE